LRAMDETVRVIRGGRDATYVVAEEHEDGSLPLRPDGSHVTTVEAAPEPPLVSPDRVSPGVILELRDLSVAYGAKTAVDHIGLRIVSGEIFGLLGPNGAGKTSTLSAIEGLVKPQSGTVLLDGIDSDAIRCRQRPGWACNCRRRAFNPSSRSSRSSARTRACTGSDSPTEITASLQEIGLGAEANKPFKQLSGGQQQRLAPYIAVVREPGLLLLDEPTAGLDPQSRRQLSGQIEGPRRVVGEPDRAVFLDRATQKR
jgi:ABC-2 type transport system ATP-binding protein